MNCKHCKEKIPPYKGNRQKEFCNSTCRSNYWYALNKKGKSKEATVNIEDQTVSNVEIKPPTQKKTNYPINTMPVRKPGEDAIDFAQRKNEWKRKQK